MFRQIGPTEIVLILLVIVLLFGAKKLPELARGSGRALRIFKAETKGLLDDDDDGVKESEKTEAQKQLEAQQRAEATRRLRTETPVDRPVDHAVDYSVDHPVEPVRPDVER